MSASFTVEEQARLARAIARVRQMHEAGDLPPSLEGLLLAERLVPLAEAEEPSPAGRRERDEMEVVAEVLRETQRRQVRLKFVALTFLRDRLLPEGWTLDRRQRAVNRALDEGLIRIQRVPNPKDASHPTAAVILNMQHPAAADPAGTAPDEAAELVQVRGAPLSLTILSERR